MVPNGTECASALSFAFAKLSNRYMLFRNSTTCLAKGADRDEFLNLLDDA